MRASPAFYPKRVQPSSEHADRRCGAMMKAGEGSSQWRGSASRCVPACATGGPFARGANSENGRGLARRWREVRRREERGATLGRVVCDHMAMIVPSPLEFGVRSQSRRKTPFLLTMTHLDDWMHFAANSYYRAESTAHCMCLLRGSGWFRPACLSAG
ncbi:hypothetical protein BDY21DRAFT_204429 [Lineolata rhizophorae]|uniref:Uncharacterized protein n=1 Tax=Lineolata rhizophorae TaxID=578093 RepID=A0A6A6P3U7_9PEZI|nr:hypothetical protein BDY21DRAFT_204429 [Lineolata rhizophorae]